ncbi:hypothetical protein ACFOYW_03105 [Gryllotalpicola reticulitermitis]|uniref:Uncharacterized protein n=1 Tax=Gryllotalpicola reticulitermitis TaxID=1184153 RepID=A0ABV8Q4U0_9MICO
MPRADAATSSAGAAGGLRTGGSDPGVEVADNTGDNVRRVKRGVIHFGLLSEQHYVP